MLDNETVKTMIKALKDEKEKEIQKYDSAIKLVQNLCNHDKTENVLCGCQCIICGKLISYN